jgi:hypothetical protein
MRAVVEVSVTVVRSNGEERHYRQQSVVEMGDNDRFVQTELTLPTVRLAEEVLGHFRYRDEPPVKLGEIHIHSPARP